MRIAIATVRGRAGLQGEAGPLVSLAIGLLIAVSGCVVQPDRSPVPEPSRSIAPDDREAGQVALEAFLTAMADPEVTYRVTGQLKVTPIDEHNQAALDIRTRYDVTGQDYAGRASLGGWDRDPAVGGDVSIAMLDGTAHVLVGMAAEEVISVPPPPSMRRPTALRALTEADLEFLGIGPDGLYEFRVDAWLGDPIGEWSDLGVMPASDFPPTTVRSHRTRLFLDVSGVPRRLLTEWTFAAADPIGDSRGTLVEEIQGLGMYVNLANALLPFGETSYTIAVGVDADNGIVTEPWREVLPVGGETASLEVAFADPDEPIMLGIEGAIGFLSSHDADGELTLDRIVNLFDVTRLEVPTGEQTLLVYYRTCGGNCSRLDGPTDFCRVEADVEGGERYRLLVEVSAPARATCTLAAVG